MRLKEDVLGGPSAPCSFHAWAEWWVELTGFRNSSYRRFRNFRSTSTLPLPTRDANVLPHYMQRGIAPHANLPEFADSDVRTPCSRRKPGRKPGATELRLIYIHRVFVWFCGHEESHSLQHLIYLRCLLPHRCGMCYRQEPTPHARPKGLLDLAKNVLENRCRDYCIDIRCKLVQ